MPRALVAATIIFAAAAIPSCGASAPTSPPLVVAPAPAISGTWNGTYTVTTCTPTPYFASCSVFSSSYPLTLVLTQADGAVSGTFDGTLPGGNKLSRPIALSGSIDGQRALRLQGGQEFVSLYNGTDFVGQPGVNFDQWMMTTDAAGTTMTGGFRETVQQRFFLLPYSDGEPIAFGTQIVTLAKIPNS